MNFPQSTLGGGFSPGSAKRHGKAWRFWRFVQS
jgi:hypothetical protein